MLRVYVQLIKLKDPRRVIDVDVENEADLCGRREKRSQESFGSVDIDPDNVENIIEYSIERKQGGKRKALRS